MKTSSDPRVACRGGRRATGFHHRNVQHVQRGGLLAAHPGRWALLRHEDAKACLMGSLRSWSYLWLIAVGVTGCSSWTGPQGSGGGTPIPDTDDIEEGDSGVPGHDDGELPHFPW